MKINDILNEGLPGSMAEQQLNELFDDQQEYFKLADGQVIRVDYKQAGLNPDGMPGSINIVPVDPKIMPMSGMQAIQPWDKARQNIRMAIQKWVQSGQKSVAEGLNEFAPAGGGGGNTPRGPRTPGRDPGGDDDSGQDPYSRPEPEYYSRSIDYFGQFEADHFDDEEFDKATGVFKGYWDDAEGRVQIGYFKFDDPAATGSDDPGMGWYYEPQNESVAEGLNEFAPGSGGGESGRWYTDDQMTDIVGDGWYEDLDVSGNISKQQMIQQAQAWLDDQGYNVQVLNAKLNDDDMDWYIEGNFHNPGFAKKGMAEGVGNIGNKIRALYQKIYSAGDDAIESMYYDSPIFAQYWDEYEGDLDSIIAEVDASELQVILAELQSAVEDQGVAEGIDDEDYGTELAALQKEFGKFTTHYDRMDQDPAYAAQWRKQNTDRLNREVPDDEDMMGDIGDEMGQDDEDVMREGKPKEKEADYGADYQDMVARVKKLAGMGPLRTVYDPQKRVYKNVPVAVQPAQQPKK